MTSKQLKNGNKAESEIAKIFHQFGFWVHIFAKNNSGSQPVDIVALRSDESWLVDVKNVRSEDASFPFSRIEPDQKTSMDYAATFANVKNVGFVIVFDREEEDPKFLPYADTTDESIKSVNISKLVSFKSLLKKS